MMNHYKIRILIGFIIFSFIIYNRIFRTREEKVFSITFDLIKALCYITIAFTMLFLCIYNSLIFYRWIRDIEPQESKNRIIIFLKKIITLYIKKPLSYINNSLESFDGYIKNNTPQYDDIQNYSDLITQRYGEYFNKFKQYFIVFGLSVIVICQSIVLLGFIYDIVYLNKFCYFYKYCWLLIFVLIIRYIIYSVNLYARINLTDLNNYIYVYILDDKNLEGSLTLENMPRITLEMYESIKDAEVKNLYYIHILCPKYIQENPNVNIPLTITMYKPQITNFYEMLVNTNSFYDKKAKYLSIFNALRYFFYSIGWSYLAYLLFFQTL